MVSDTPVTIDSLPPELLSQILGYLEPPPPSPHRFHDQPNERMLKQPENDLKISSLVCRRWRATALPVLFRHIIWRLDRWQLVRVDPTQGRDPIEELPLLSFLRDNDLGHRVDSLTIVMRDSLQGMAFGGTRDDNLERAKRMHEEGSNSSLTAGVEMPSLFSDRSEWWSGNSGPGPRYGRSGSQWVTTYNEDNNWVWDLLFSIMDPRTFTIMATPQVLATLLSMRIYLNDAWSFSRHADHILSLSRETKSPRALTSTSSTSGKTAEPVSSSSSSSKTPDPSRPSSSVSPPDPPKRSRSTLFTIRPWTHLLLNEGSSTRVYKTYEFFHRRPPSILNALLGSDRSVDNPPLVPPTLKSLAYVSIFPLSSHFSTLVNNLPRLEKLFVQVVPRNDILRDQEEMRNIQHADLWMERNTCYSLVMRELLSSELPGHDDDDDDNDDDDANADDQNGSDTSRENNWRYLREFESGDAADKEAWDMAVQFVCMSGTGWRVEREGVFVKGHLPPTVPASPNSLLAGTGEADLFMGDNHHEDQDDDHEHTPEPFQGQLERMAFRGTAHLPYSPVTGSVESYVFAELPWVYTNSNTMDVDFFALLQDVTGQDLDYLDPTWYHAADEDDPEQYEYMWLDL
ncbi:F-box domain-containing protein [Apodospora peruviana]|uniref:F-box domain-containing protein n=1 Tax=Apodospora peruviana TaxID=516989 RepID=A0AAE0MD92_9PEZI|nr:F-box domain-containing protein [Apodospora peruviana]